MARSLQAGRRRAARGRSWWLLHRWDGRHAAPGDPPRHILIYKCLVVCRTWFERIVHLVQSVTREGDGTKVWLQRRGAAVPHLRVWLGGGAGWSHKVTLAAHDAEVGKAFVTSSEIGQTQMS